MPPDVALDPVDGPLVGPERLHLDRQLVRHRPSP
jgi:hypothetical protein